MKIRAAPHARGAAACEPPCGRGGGVILLALAALYWSAPARAADVDPLAWPTATRESRPWTRWWWMGSAVDKPDLTRQLTQYRDAGIGGVEICPIYGAHGYESKFIDFLSPLWMDMLTYTTTEAQRLGMGVDMTTGTGWPFGGPGVTEEDASAKIILKRYDVAGGAGLGDTLPAGRLQCLEAFGSDGQRIDLTGRVTQGRLNWTAPPGRWRLYAAVQSGPVQKVKRAAPGGVGSVLNPFSISAMDHYLANFDRAFAGYSGAMPRSQFHDSYEYYGAQWSSELFPEFQKRRGYDLRTQLPALMGEGEPDTVARVQGDYRETLSDLHQAYIARWTAWAHAHKSLTREQAHGSPTNLLDTYATADIPETEIFGSVEQQQIPLALNKFASSAAHVSGHTLSSSESFTWLTEHFQASLSQVKQAADYLFLTGVNHIFFHGIPYSPADAPWPGWQFYAAVNFGPQGGLWHDLPEFNAYVTRCQSILQGGKPSNDVLLYLPVEDFWNAPGALIETNPMPRSFTSAASKLWDRGYGFDYVSDRFLKETRNADGDLSLGGNRYRVLLVPSCHKMADGTLARLTELARGGATVLVQDDLPGDVPGLGDLEKRRAALRKTLAEIRPAPTPDSGIRLARVGKGRFLIGADIDALLQAAGAPREPMADPGLRFVRRARPDGYDYFLADRGDSPVNGWVTLGTPARSAALLDPRFADHAGIAAIRQGDKGAAQVYLQLQPGESRILRTFTDRQVTGPPWAYAEEAGAPQPINGDWRVTFLEGGPNLPAAATMPTLASWTTLDDAEAKRFAGTARYTIDFDAPSNPDANGDWLLDLGRVCESARVRLNGQEVGRLFCAPFQIRVGKWLRPGKNTLEVEVTNLAANRIADMDRRGVAWKHFYDANVASKNAKGVLDASSWPLFDSGLIGPVRLIPLKPATLTTTAAAASEKREVSSAMSTQEQIEASLDVAPVWAGHPVGFALLTHGDRQFVAFYDDQRRMTVGERRLTEDHWQFVHLPESVGWDSHNYIALTADDDGYLHLSGNMHAVPLVFFRTTKPLDITTFERMKNLVGTNEAQATYPTFFRGPKNELIFTYRDGYSGNGNQIYDIYDHTTRTWHRLLDKPLTDGEGHRNAYFSGPTKGPDGYYHLVWVWRETGDAATNHDPSYARSRDLVHWEKSDGTPLTLPITLETGEIVDHIPVHGGVINNNVKVGFDSQKRPIVSYHKYDALGNIQIYNARREADGWKIYQTSAWDWRWDFGGGGSIPFEIHLNPVQAHPDGTLTQSYGTMHHGSGNWLLDPTTLKAVETLPERPAYPPSLEAVTSSFPGMQVDWAGDSGASGEPGVRYVLRWETLGINRDHPRTGALPPPSMLRLYKLKR